MDVSPSVVMSTSLTRRRSLPEYAHAPNLSALRVPTHWPWWPPGISGTRLSVD